MRRQYRKQHPTKKCSAFIPKLERTCLRKALLEPHSDGKYYCGKHGDFEWENRCTFEWVTKKTGKLRKCGRTTAIGFDRCRFHNGPPSIKNRQYSWSRDKQLKHNIRKHMHKGEIAVRVMALGDLEDPIQVSMDTLKKSVAVLQLATEDFEDIRAGKVKQDGEVVQGNREDIIFLSSQIEMASKAAERTLNMMAKKALTQKELDAARDRVLRAVRETINQFVEPGKREDAFQFAAEKLRTR
jgi:hypothetical protein